MHDSSRALLKRSGIAAAATALVIGSSFAAPAIATTTESPAPAGTETSAADTTGASKNDSKADLPAGLEDAVKRDLGISIEEFYKNGELNSVVESLSKELKQAKLDAGFEIAGSKIKVEVAAPALKAVTKKLDALTKDTKVELEIVAVEAATSTEKVNAEDSSAAPVKDASGEAKASASPKASGPTVADSPKIDAKTEPDIKVKANPRSVDALLDAYVASVEPNSVSELQAVMKTGNGSFVIRTGGAAKTEASKGTDSPKASALRFSDKLTAEEFAAQYTKVSLEIADGPAKSAADTDVLGGMGYGAENNAGGYNVCSLGFAGFNADGADAAISAGHCERDGDITDVKILEHSAPEKFDGPGADLGTFGFSQFGGPNNAPVTGLETAQDINDVGNIGTDISVIDKINPDLDLHALVSDWTTSDVRDSSVKVTGVTKAVKGVDICKSGRTTGWTCGTVDEVGIFLVGGFTGAGDLRGVRGFGMSNPIAEDQAGNPIKDEAGNDFYTKARPGDSGGSVIAGGTAVGVTSAVGTVELEREDETTEVVGRAYFTDIKDGLAHTDGYTIAMFLNAPAVATLAQGSDIAVGQTLNGTVSGAPSGSTVKIKSAGQKDISAKVANDKFSFKAPVSFGKYDFTMQTVNGFNNSAVTKGSFNVVLAAPAITTPKADSTVNAPVSTISGTGVAGAVVTLTGDASGTATVTADGKWSVKLSTSLSYGEYSVSATQAKDGQTSKAAKSSFKIQLAAPAITSPADGKSIIGPQDEIAGTGVAGATVKLSGAVTENVEVGADGKWSVILDEALSYGSHSITAMQTSGETTSPSVKTAFKVVPAAPSIDSPEDGQEFAFDKAPKTISGFGINGATVKVTIGDTELTATAAGGAWTVMAPKDLETGDYKVTAVQVIDEVSSAPVSIDFTIAAEPKPEPTEKPTASPKPSQAPSDSPEPSKAPVKPQGNTDDNDDDASLANTGPNEALPFIATGGVLLVAGGAFLLFRRKNIKGHHGA
ncbi:Ig-like domain-containing protein [Paeniglutamicibacter gangotriensis]|uniref:Ig-like domain-containing protein n=1 Tax=Paeniglutamicibacter gangotriensis TaxID=254787 RepID=UPI0037CC2B2E